MLLDTNVISEPLRPKPERRVVEWIDAQPVETLYLPAIAVAELRTGVALLPAGQRRDRLREHLEHRVLPLFAGRVLPFDLSCTRAYAALRAKVHRSGLSIAVADGYIAAIAVANEFTVVTRDVSPFEAAGLTVVNPWRTRAVHQLGQGR